jgi:hypothetical protein
MFQARFLPLVHKIVEWEETAEMVNGKQSSLPTGSDKNCDELTDNFTSFDMEMFSAFTDNFSVTFYDSAPHFVSNASE